MNPVFPVLGRAAAVGALIGIGGELVADDSSLRGFWLVSSIVTFVALRALCYYCGVDVSVGIVLGAMVGLGQEKGIRKVIGGGILGGSIGYLLNRLAAHLPPIYFFPVYIRG